MARTEFDHDRFSDAYPPGIERSWWHVARNRTIARVCARHLPTGTRLLEVGCGTGIVTTYLRSRGWDAWGVDLGVPADGPHAHEHLMFGTNALEMPDAERRRYGALALFDVIEHIADAPLFLRELLAAFPNARRMVITVPARDELWTTFDDHYGHFRRYDLAMFRDELSRAGSRAVHAGYFFHGVYPAIALNNMLRGRERDIRFTAPPSGGATVINRIIGEAFSLEARILPRGLPGSSIIGVAERMVPSHHP